MRASYGRDLSIIRAGIDKNYNQCTKKEFLWKMGNLQELRRYTYVHTRRGRNSQGDSEGRAGQQEHCDGSEDASGGPTGGLDEAAERNRRKIRQQKLLT